MSRDDIIKLAIQSHLVMADYDHPSLEAFTNLVAAAEREACAKVCEDTDIVEFQHCMVLHEDAAKTLRNAAAAIRARGEK